MSDEELENQIDLSTTGDLATDAALKVAKAAGRGFLQGITESSRDVWGGLLGDRIGQWKLRNLINSLERTARLFEAKGIPIENAKHLPNGELLLIFEGMSKSDDDELSSLWARLLANDMTSSEATNSKMCASILEQMSSDVAVLFQQLTLIERKKISDKAQQATLLDLFLKEQNALSASKKHRTFENSDLEDAITNGWKKILDEENLSEGYIETLKIELLRLNLIQPKQYKPNFDTNPFDRGMRVNEAGLDQVLSDMQSEMEELVYQTTAHEARGLFSGPKMTGQVQFELSKTGIHFAEALGIL